MRGSSTPQRLHLEQTCFVGVIDEQLTLVDGSDLSRKQTRRRHLGMDDAIAEFSAVSFTLAPRMMNLQRRLWDA